MTTYANDRPTVRDWRTRGLARAKAFLAATVVTESYDPMDSAGALGTYGTTGKTGTGSQTWSGSKVTLATGATANSYAFQGFTANQVQWLYGGPSWYARTRIKMGSANGANAVVGIAALLAGTPATTMFAVGMVGATKLGSATKYSAMVSDTNNAAIRGPAYAQALDTTTYRTLEAWSVAGFTQIYTSLDEAQIVAVPNAGCDLVRNANLVVGVWNNADTTSYQCVVDDMQVYVKVS